MKLKLDFETRQSLRKSDFSRHDYLIHEDQHIGLTGTHQNSNCDPRRPRGECVIREPSRRPFCLTSLRILDQSLVVKRDLTFCCRTYFVQGNRAGAEAGKVRG